MKQTTLFLAFWSVFGATAQDGLRSIGALRIHDTGGLGLYVNLLNDGILDNNRGLVGFYGDNTITVSGAFSPVFHDIEVMANSGVQLAIGMGVENNANFILGDIGTPRTNASVALTFEQDAFYTGAYHLGKVDGYVTVKNHQNFIFPVGDREQLRPLILDSENSNSFSRCAYFYEDPHWATNAKEAALQRISNREFWRLEGSVPSSVQLSWNERSTISLLTDNVDAIVIVGWSKSNRQWESLGGTAVGDLSQGVAESDSFVPDNYEALTFGSVIVPKQMMDLPNYLLTPNGDGINDFLKIDELEQSPRNQLRIYDRNGMLVFQKENYINEFNGYATEGDVVINRGSGLPSGVYFYLVQLYDLDLEYQGYLYLANN
ncbi:gliding motility-associated C-terminal domain-containing protein [Flagellimonas amoyensis]|uniref:gliding motility-associated C-terminal domain-containing protein n=1 Tax=Flagellimonas amoyensis TaxID=2169401 RepID=UPI000D3D28B5|nr:gliding motility-associated C-terminal domain-containing protein [Allomuricauda amoyensis]